MSDLGEDSQAPLRMRTVFAKSLVFAGDGENAARTLGFTAECATEQPYLDVLDSLEHSSEQQDREANWTTSNRCSAHQ